MALNPSQSQNSLSSSLSKNHSAPSVSKKPEESSQHKNSSQRDPAALRAIILAQPNARTFGSGEVLNLNSKKSSFLDSPEWSKQWTELPPSRDLKPEELASNWVSHAWRASDIPLPFHSDQSHLQSKTLMSMMDWVNEEGRILQYLFEDGLCLTAGELLRHPRGRQVPRLLLPLTLQIRPEASEVSLAHRPASLRPQWVIHTDQAVATVLFALDRVNRGLLASDDGEDAIQLLYTTEADPTKARKAIRLNSVQTEDSASGPSTIKWIVRSDEESEYAFHGKVRIQPISASVPDATETYHFNKNHLSLVFHRWHDRVDGVKAFLSSSMSPDAVSNNGEIRLTGYSKIQALLEEIEHRSEDKKHVDKIEAEPASFVIEKQELKPHLQITSDGSFKIKFTFPDQIAATKEKADAPSPTSSLWEIHGIPQSLHYIVYLLQAGLGATTGIANTQLAHNRRGPKRERDLKLLRHVGFASLLFYEASSFAFGQPGSDGESPESLVEMRARLFRKFANFLNRSDHTRGESLDLDYDETPDDSLLTFEGMVSDGVVSLLDGLINQIIDDCKERRETRVFLPDGEYRIRGLSSQVMRLFRSLLADLAVETDGSCFTKVRANWFDNFTNKRETFNQEDIVLRRSLSHEEDIQHVYSPGINERFIIPTDKLPPRGNNLLTLAYDSHDYPGFQITLDGKSIELIQDGEFRPEFNLKEGSSQTDLESLALGNRKIDWFELHPRFFFRGKELSPEDAMSLSRDGIIEHEGRYFLLEAKELPNLKRLTRFWESLRGTGQGLLADKSKRRRTEETYFQLPRTRALELLALRASGIAIQGGEKWQAICAFYDSLDKDREPLTLPESFKTTLQAYQTVGVQWLLDIRRLGLGGILADDMGLGKTVTSLAFLEILRAKGELGPTLILVPTSLTYNWMSEIHRFTPELKCHLFSSRSPEALLDFVQERETGVVICTYGLLQENIELFEQVPWSVAVFDEAQALKTITTKRTTAARKLRAEFKLCLTGTPLENHYGEFYSLFDLCVSGALGELPAFRERYVNPVRVLREDLDELKLKTRPLLMRRTKSQVMHELPEKIETTMRLPFDEEQKKIYRDIATSYNRQIRDQISKEGEGKTQLQMLTALLRLRQVCSDPSGIPGVKYDSEPPKISTLIDALGEITSEDSSALVFTQFLATFERIKSSLKEAGIPFYEMSGSDSRAEREKMLRGFDEHKGGAVMLMTLKTGGVGLNLVKASYIFHIEPWWNPAVENQATDRAHRIGQTKSVQVYRYIIQDSVEEKIEVLKELKSRRFDALFGEPGSTAVETDKDMLQISSRLTQKDFEFLLS